MPHVTHHHFYLVFEYYICPEMRRSLPVLGQQWESNRTNARCRFPLPERKSTIGNNFLHLFIYLRAMGKLSMQNLSKPRFNLRTFSFCRANRLCCRGTALAGASSAQCNITPFVYKIKNQLGLIAHAPMDCCPGPANLR